MNEAEFIKEVQAASLERCAQVAQAAAQRERERAADDTSNSQY